MWPHDNKAHVESYSDLWGSHLVCYGYTFMPILRSLLNFSFSIRICLVYRKMLLVCMCVGFVCVLVAVADRDSQGKRHTSVRINAIEEFGCLVDPSGPLSLFSISIYHHFSSQDHISVTPQLVSPHPTRSISSFTDFEWPHTKRETLWIRWRAESSGTVNSDLSSGESH